MVGGGGLESVEILQVVSDLARPGVTGLVYPANPLGVSIARVQPGGQKGAHVPGEFAAAGAHILDAKVRCGSVPLLAGQVQPAGGSFRTSSEGSAPRV